MPRVSRLEKEIPMKSCLTRPSLASIVILLVTCHAVGQTETTRINHFVITDDGTNANSATFFKIDAVGNLTRYKTVKTGGVGGEQYFASRQVKLVDDDHQECVFVSDSGSSDVAAIHLESQKLVGTFKGSANDFGTVGLAANDQYMYAAFVSSRTIATFKVQSDCRLEFVGDVSAAGLDGGAVDGTAVNDNTLVVAYADGSIQSFDVSGGIPVSNNDEQFSTGYKRDGGEPAGVRMTKDGHYAIFGDAGLYVEVEVSDISSGKLTPTVDYGGSGGGLGPGDNSNNIQFNSDESLLYISVNYSGEVAAAFFDKTTGTLSEGCNSGPLKGYKKTWDGAIGIGVEPTSDHGGVLYVAEADGQGAPSIGVVQVSSSSGTCTLKEVKNSPVTDPNGGAMWSIGVF
jgi:6-phosphogluconolactonase (cycloisomerase 2 family)